MNTPVCRFGILGTANIARKNWQAIHHAQQCALSAVASRDRGRAEQFIAECQAHTPHAVPPQAVGSYEELIASPTVDALYIPLPTAVRTPWAIRAAEAGKHILVEKPVGVCAADVERILAACRHSGVQFMDGVMFMHSRRLARLREVLDDGQSVGPIRRITSHFSFPAPESFFQSDIRAHSELEPLGCLGDLGWYNIRFTLWALGWTMPSQVRAFTHAARRHTDSRQGVPVEFSAELLFADGVSANFYCSFTGAHQQWAHVCGTQGAVLVPDFVLPHYGSEAAFTLSNDVFSCLGCDFNMEQRTRRIATPEYSNSAPGAQEANMFSTFARLALSGKLDPQWGQMALATQQVVDACLAAAT